MGLRTRIEELAAGITTTYQGREALGVCLLRVQKGRTLLDDVTTWAGARQQARELLDQCERYAGRVLAGLGDAPDDQPLSQLDRDRVGLALAQTADAVQIVADATRDQSFSEEFFSAIQRIVSGLARAAGKGLALTWPIWVAIAAGVAVLFTVRRAAA